MSALNPEARKVLKAVARGTRLRGGRAPTRGHGSPVWGMGQGHGEEEMEPGE